MGLSDYKEVFLSDANEHVKTLNNNLLKLEKDPENLKLVDEMVEPVKSLKSMAGTMGFDQITSLAYQMEKLLDAVKNKKIVLEKRVTNLLFESLDVIENLLDQIEVGEEVDDVTDLVEKLKKIIAAESQEKYEKDGTEERKIEEEKEKESIKKAKEQGKQVYLVTVKLDRDCLLKSVRAYMVLKEVKALGNIIKSIPGEQDLESGIFTDSFQLIVQTKATDELIKNKIEKIPEIEKVTVESYEVSEPKREKPSYMEDKQRELLEKKRERFVRVDREKLDYIIGLVGELVVNRTRVLELSKSLGDSNLKDALEQLDLITSNLQNAVMKLRMVNIKQIYDRFPRLVRDLSQRKNKKINLVMEGEETELDRSIVNVIEEPLSHLIKNAIDHGIERAPDRNRLNKKEVGTIKLSARHEGSHVLIEIEDDGHGIDSRIVRTKAIEKGLKTPQELEKMSEDEIIQLVFEKNISLSEEDEGTFHRGEGLDKVKSIIETLNGEISLETTIKRGTKFNIKLPLTLAIIKALLAKVDESIYAIPVESIRENIHVYPKDVKRMQGQQVIHLREEIIRLISVRSKLGLDKGEEFMDKDTAYPVIIVKAGGKKAGFIVDELLYQQEIVIKSLGKLLEGLRGIAGATVLANGEVALILDVSSMI